MDFFSTKQSLLPKTDHAISRHSSSTKSTTVGHITTYHRLHELSLTDPIQQAIRSRAATGRNNHYLFTDYFRIRNFIFFRLDLWTHQSNSKLTTKDSEAEELFRNFGYTTLIENEKVDYLPIAPSGSVYKSVELALAGPFESQSVDLEWVNHRPIPQSLGSIIRIISVQGVNRRL